MTKDSFILYKSWAEMMSEMPDKELAELMRAIACYQTGKDFDIKSPMVSAVFSMVRDQFEKDDEKYEETCRRRSESGKKGGRPTNEEKQEKAKESKCFLEKAKKADYESESYSESDIKEKVGAKAPKKEKAQKRFIPPTLEQVQEYCEERKNGIDAQHFIDYYASQKWKKANGQPLTDWKAGVRTWERKDKEDAEKARSGTKVNAFNAFEQRQNNYDEIEARMLQRRVAK